MRDVSRGRELARELIARVAPQAAVVKGKLGRSPTLAIIAAADHHSRRFVQAKRDMLAEFPIHIDAVFLVDDVTSEQAVQHVVAMNEREEVDAIFVQFPLPGTVDVAAILSAIHPTKDIDREPVAARAACDLLLAEMTTVGGARVMIYGSEDEFTRSLAAMLGRDEAKLTTSVRDADVLVVTEQLPDERMLDQIERLHVLLDAGYYLRPRPAEWIPARVRDRISTHLTQYGNVGPLTIAHLAELTVRAAFAVSGNQPPHAAVE